MYAVQITAKRSLVRQEVGKFTHEEDARACAERKLKGYRGGVAEVIDESDGGFIRSIICIGRG